MEQAISRPKRQRLDLAATLQKLNFDEQLTRMGELNPAYTGALTDAKISKALRKELQEVFIGKGKDENGRFLPLSRRAIMARLAAITTSISSRVEQIEALQPQNGTQPEFSRDEAETAVRTFLKTVQEVLSHPDDRRAFDRGEDDVDNIIIDPLLITDTLLTNLGLAQYIPEKGTKEPEKVSQRAKAIPDIKEMLKHLEPMRLPGQQDHELKYFRLMRMSGGENEGMILGTQVINGQKVIFKTDLYGSGRRLAHIEARYLEEIDLLQKIAGVIKNALAHLSDWASISEDDLAEIRDGILECVDSLENVENKDKVALHEQLEKSLTLRDSLGRYNPGATTSRLIKAQTHLTSRIMEIEAISRYLTVDKLKMRGLVAEQVNPIEKFLATVATTHHSFRLLKPESEMSPAKKAEILRNLKGLKAISDQQKYEPFLSFGRKFSAQLEKAHAALQNDDRRTAAHEFTKVYLVAKMERAYKEIQSAYSKISLQGDTTDPVTLYAEIKSIHSRLQDHNVAPDIKTTEYDQAFIELYHLLNSLKKRLREIAPAQQDFDFDDRAEPVAAPTAREAKKSRIDEVLERVEKIPAVGKVIAEIRGILGKVWNRFKASGGSSAPIAPQYSPVIKTASPAPAAPISESVPTPEKYLTREEAFKAMKKRIKRFNFRELAKNLP